MPDQHTFRKKNINYRKFGINISSAQAIVTLFKAQMISCVKCIDTNWLTRNCSFQKVQWSKIYNLGGQMYFYSEWYLFLFQETIELTLWPYFRKANLCSSVTFGIMSSIFHSENFCLRISNMVPLLAVGLRRITPKHLDSWIKPYLRIILAPAPSPSPIQYVTPNWFKTVTKSSARLWIVGNWKSLEKY